MEGEARAQAPGRRRGRPHGCLRRALYQGFFAAWLRGGEQGDFLYVVDPEAQEQVTLGRFVPIEATEKEKRKILRQISREQRKGRLIGIELDDLGQWDTWLSASLRDKGGKSIPGTASFEPEKYTIELSVAERDLKLQGRARLDLRPILRGSRAVNLRLNNDLQVVKVTDTSGAELFVQRAGRGSDRLPVGAACRKTPRSASSWSTPAT